MRREWYLWLRSPICLLLSTADCLVCLGILLQEEPLYLRFESAAVLLVLFTGLLTVILFGREHDSGALKVRLLTEKKQLFYGHKLRLLYMRSALISLWYVICIQIEASAQTPSSAAAVSIVHAASSAAAVPATQTASLPDAASAVQSAASLSSGLFAGLSLFLCLHCYICLSLLVTELLRSSIAGTGFLMFLFFLENRLCLQWLPQNLLFIFLEKALYFSEPGDLPGTEIKKLAGYSILLLSVSRRCVISGRRSYR